MPGFFVLILLACVSMLRAADCASCHREIVARFAATAMANSSGPVVASSEASGAFFHAPSATTYQVRKEGDRLDLSWPGGKVALDLYIGSRRMGRSYAWQENGFFYEAPAGYYATRRAWDVAPGYESDPQPDLARPLTADCLFCHAGGARIARGTASRIENWRELHGVTCERCHGDGEAHAAHPTRANIVNPARLETGRRDAVCEQCHLAGEARVRRAGRELERFQPGESLSDYLAVYLASADSRGVSVNGHAEGLARSRCRQSNSRLWCGTCHDPHGAPVSSFREKCLTCHQAADCPSPDRDRSDCVACHMPKSRAYDGGHTTFTDHSIPRRPSGRNQRPQAPDDLAAYYGGTNPRNLGLAWFQAAEKHRDERLYSRAWPLLREAALNGPADPVLDTHLAYLLDRNGRSEQAEHFYRRALEKDPANATALANLGDLLFRRGLKNEAAALWKKALDVNPYQPALRRALASIR
jgi:hypothetical protein